ncbi:hypothetical protein VTK26DRAFT_3653 [Humicola hyalothermophila]
MVVAPGVRVRLLASCSDDRTVRVWDVTEYSGGGGEAAGAGTGTVLKTLAEARETGFGGNSEAKQENENDSSRCVAVAMGHVSRIWHVKFSGRTDHCAPRPGPIEVHSFGEDCSRQRWELSLDWERWRSWVNATDATAGATIGTLRHGGANTCHSGKNIWSVAVLGREEGDPLIATGGADGKIAVSGELGSETSTSSKEYQDLDVSVSLEEVLESLSGGTQPPFAQTKKGPKNAFQRYAFLSDERFMATTSSGRLLLLISGPGTSSRAQQGIQPCSAAPPVGSTSSGRDMRCARLPISPTRSPTLSCSTHLPLAIPSMSIPSPGPWSSAFSVWTTHCSYTLRPLLPPKPSTPGASFFQSTTSSPRPPFATTSSSSAPAPENSPSTPLTPTPTRLLPISSPSPPEKTPKLKTPSLASCLSPRLTQPTRSSPPAATANTAPTPSPLLPADLLYPPPSTSSPNPRPL